MKVYDPRRQKAAEFPPPFLFGYPFSLENDIFTLSFLGEQVDEVILIDGLNRLKKLFN